MINTQYMHKHSDLYNLLLFIRVLYRKSYSPKLHLFDQKTVKTVIFFCTLFCLFKNVFSFCNGKVEFLSIRFSSLSPDFLSDTVWILILILIMI